MASTDWGALRFAIAVPVAYAFTAGVQEGLGLPVAFLLGTFPTKTIFTTGRRLARNNLKLEDEAPRSADKIDVLQGINLKVAERFEEENITTIPQLAYCDVIDLTIRTGYEFSFVVDCASQALAYLYLEEQLPKLRIYGLRGAQEIGWFIDHVERSEGAEVHDEEKEVKVGEEDEDVQEIFGETPPEAVTRIAQALQLNPHGFWHALRQIAGDPYTKFLRDIWQTSTIGPAVHISALVPNPAGQDSGNKTVTIRNDGDDDVSLEGWYLRNARDKTCPLSGKVKGESEKVVRIKDSSFLDNAEDEISLLDPDGTVVDAFCYYGTSVVEGGAITLGH